MLHETALVKSWRQIVTDNNKEELSLGLKQMNDSLDTKYRHSRISEWEKGVKKPNLNAINYMMRIVLTELLSKEGLTKRKAQNIISKIEI